MKSDSPHLVSIQQILAISTPWFGQIKAQASVVGDSLAFSEKQDSLLIIAEECRLQFWIGRNQFFHLLIVLGGFRRKSGIGILIGYARKAVAVSSSM